MVLAFVVLTPKLPCPSRFIHLMFESSIAGVVELGQISLVVKCTDDCICPHLTISDMQELKLLRVQRNLKQLWAFRNSNAPRLATLNAVFSF